MIIGGRPSNVRAVALMSRTHSLGRSVSRLAQVVEEEVDGGLGELAGPLPGGRVERDLDAVEAVPLELAP